MMPKFAFTIRIVVDAANAVAAADVVAGLIAEPEISAVALDFDLMSDEAAALTISEFEHWMGDDQPHHDSLCTGLVERCGSEPEPTDA
jgi:hypothetical protein